LRQLLTERYRGRLAGVLSCYDRIIVTGTLPGACYAKGMTAFLSARQIRIFDYPRFAEPLRDRIRDRAAELASAASVTIEHVAKSHIRKEDIIAKVLAVRGDWLPFGLPRLADHPVYFGSAILFAVPFDLVRDSHHGELRVAVKGTTGRFFSRTRR